MLDEVNWLENAIKKYVKIYAYVFWDPKYNGISLISGMWIDHWNALT